MDKRTLVRQDLEAGRQIVEGLDHQGISVDTAAWLRDDESGLWHLVISSPSVAAQGAGPVYEVVDRLLRQQDSPALDLTLDDITVVAPGQHLIRDLKKRVATDDEIYEIRLHDARVYRALGTAIDNGARVRVKQTGHLGTVRGVFQTSQGPRYLVMYDITPDDLKPLDAAPRPPSGQDYAADELEFLYVVRTGGWPETLPEVTRPAS